jgi:TetR/AcrR family transcriptional repressor of mexCD-oprJ operon
MAHFGTEKDDHKIMSALALALVQHPRASLQELAKAVGISKATLYRFCRTREELIERLTTYSMAMITAAIESAELETAPPLEALRKLTMANLEHKEATSFLINYCKPDAEEEAKWENRMDGFFLRGQQAGVFRIDIPAAALTEIWVGLLIGLVEAERRGRVARIGIADLFESAFLRGVAAK